MLVWYLSQLLYFKGSTRNFKNSARYIFGFIFVHSTFRAKEHTVISFVNNRMISAATLDCLDWIGVEITLVKEFFPFLKYLR